MVDIGKHVDYWRGGAEEDIAAASSLLETGHPRHALFFAHLAVEKMLKALVVQVTDEAPPKIHDLVRLARIAGAKLSSDRLDTLGRLRQYCLEGRYPESWPPPPSRREAERGLGDARELMGWISSLLK